MTTAHKMSKQKLRLLPLKAYPTNENDDPLQFYYVPFFGTLYRGRVEICLNALKSGQRVLEVGFGSGISFLNLAEQYDEIYGIDLRFGVAAVRKAFAAVGLDVRLSTASLLNLPYKDGFFDTVLCISILEHLRPEQQSLAMREIQRVLKPGGRFVYGVPAERPLMQLGFRSIGYDIRDYHFSTEVDVANTARTIFQQVAIHRYQPFGKLVGTLYEVGVFERTKA